MYLRSLVTCKADIWLVGLPRNIAEEIQLTLPVLGVEPHFIVMDELPENADKVPSCVVFSLAKNRPEQAKRLGDEDTLVVGYLGQDEKADDRGMELLDEIWDSPKKGIIPKYFKIVQNRIWERYNAWLIKNWWQTTINMVPDLAWYKNLAGTHLEVNAALARTVKKTVAECRGQRHGVIWGLKPEEYEEGERVCLESDMKVVNTGKLVVGSEQVMDNGEMRDLKTYKTPVFDKEGNVIGTAGVAQDVTLLMRYHEKILDMAHKDQLTGLFNRRFIDQTFEDIWLKGKTSSTGVLLIDVDKFKQINDTFGHLVGDAVIRCVAEAIQATVRGGDIAGRFGGDEFIVLLPGAEEKTIKLVAERLLGRVRDLPELRAREVTLSIGCTAGCADKNAKAEQLLKQADEALYKAKEHGRDRFVIYKQEG